MDIGVKEIDAWHRARGWTMVGYNDVIRRDGRLEAGRPWGAHLAHATGHNEGAIAVCLVGGVDENKNPEGNFTPDQLRTLDVYLDFAKLRYPEAEIKGHRDLPGVAKDCPSFDVTLYRTTGEVTHPRKG